MRGKVLVGSIIVFLLSISSLAGAIGDLRLVEAVKARDKGTVVSLLKQDADVNVAQPDGATPLQWAAYWDDLETADLLIRAGASVNAPNDYGVTPLSLACTNGSAAMVETLLKAGANANATLPTGETALMTCARAGNADAVKSLLAKGADVKVKETRGGQTALMWAAAQKRAGVVQVLIEHGADIHARSDSGFTPMLFAARVGDVDSTRVLLKAGADVNEATPVQGNSGAAPAYEAAGSAQPASSVMTPLLMASASGHEALSIFLLENGADANSWDGRAAPLHYAVMKGISYLHFRPSMPELVKALIAHGANPNVRLVRSAVSGLGGGPGATPFLLAAAAADTQMMRILLAAGADPKLATKANVTPLMAAAGLIRAEAFTQAEQQDALEAVKLMVELGADVNAANDAGRTALHGATNMYAEGIIQFLAEHGANMDAKDKYQQSPLSIASGIHLPWVPKGDELGEQGSVKQHTVDLLLKLGATPLNTPGYFTPIDEDSDASRFNPKHEVPGLSK